MTPRCWQKPQSRAPLTLFLLISSLLIALIASRASAGEKSPKIIILELHGLKQGIIDENLEGLPNFQEMLKGPNNDQAYVYLPQVFTTIPAASQPAVTSMYTGLYPQRTGVVSTIWFDRTTYKIRTLISYAQTRMNNILKEGGVKSLFDYVGESGKHSMTTMLMLTKGADWSVKSGALFWGNASLLNGFRHGKWFPNSHYVDNKTLDGFLTGHISAYPKSLAGIFKYHHLVPDVMVVQLLGTDLFSHFPVGGLRERQASMEEIQKHYAKTVLDPLMGRLIQKLKELGIYQDIIFILASEHGSLRIKKHIADDTLHRSLKGHFKLPRWGRGNSRADAVIMLGACTKEVYLKNRESGKWMDPPQLLADVKPAVDLLLVNPDVKTSLYAMIIRQYPGERHEGLEERDLWWFFDWRDYQASTGDDTAFRQALRPLSEMSDHFELADYLIQGLRRQYTRETAPDIKLINKKGYYFERDLDKYGHHGSYYPDDCIVSFWVAGPGLSQVVPGQHVYHAHASTLDLVPMVAHLLGIPIPEGLDGSNPLAKLPIPTNK
ncbi:MAG: alkaline phosphatase family protein [Deltaproteobacteria bacterium]|nr:MAG: alkaline phosphatase family protein [Deltaproteobacteria bacterium]